MSYLETLLKKIDAAASGSCECGTKTPQYLYHAPNCRYRVLMEAFDTIRDLQKAIKHA